MTKICKCGHKKGEHDFYTVQGKNYCHCKSCLYPIECYDFVELQICANCGLNHLPHTVCSMQPESGKWNFKSCKEETEVKK